MASASIAQVHEARLVGGPKVAVKIVRDDVERLMGEGFTLLRPWVWLADRSVPACGRLRALSRFDELRAILLPQCDMAREGRNQEEVRANFEGHPHVYIPRVHGELTRRGVLAESDEILVTMGAQNALFLIANLLADVHPDDFVGDTANLDALRQILLEQFLIVSDDGWVFRQARFYRGAVQVEDEQSGASRLLMAMLADPNWLTPSRFVLLRESVRLLPVSAEPRLGSEIRQLAIDIADTDADFAPLRVKIHGIPDAGDAEMVRRYAKSKGKAQLAGQYASLATKLDALNAPQTAVRRLESLAAETRNAALKNQLQAAAKRLEGTPAASERVVIAAALSADWRRQIESDGAMKPLNRLRLLLASLAIEQEVFAVGNRLTEQSPDAPRAMRLAWLQALADALYGSGLLSERQRAAIARQIADTSKADTLDVTDYANSLRYLARVPQWAQQLMEFQFGTTVQRWSRLTPIAAHLVPDRLRGSPLLVYTRVLDGLVQDSNALIGVRHQLFGEPVGTGLRALNPGLRRGVLLLPPDDGDFRRDGIYLLPSTTPELPPVAGILTRGEGSSLSHVQLLARNLGIPNVVIDEARISQVMPHVGQPIVLAVSPRGAVEISRDDEHWQTIFGREAIGEDVVIQPDLGKLDLKRTDLLALSDVRASDSGRIVGPKAANLGELRSNYPAAVNPGVVIPFGAFRRVLEQPLEPGGPSVFSWMRSEYPRIHAIDDAGMRQQEIDRFLSRLRDWITTSDPGDAFRRDLRDKMDEVFGDAETVGVFVRSDTNVEDLPGFTGAGLNLTLPNVVGFDAVVDAIRRVWASPFTARAYAWRQSHMTQPEHVYPAVLLLKTFASEKSGVLVTADVDTGDRQWLSIAVGEGVGGAVDGQPVEELRVRRSDGRVRLLAQASAPTRAQPATQGGIRQVPASGRDDVLSAAEIEQLRALADDVERRFPMPGVDGGGAAPADIEFGFADGRLALFQIRPFVESTRARRSAYLIGMDRHNADAERLTVDLSVKPGSP